MNGARNIGGMSKESILHGLMPFSFVRGRDPTLRPRSMFELSENGVIGNFNRTCRKPGFAGVDLCGLPIDSADSST